MNRQHCGQIESIVDIPSYENGPQRVFTLSAFAFRREGGANRNMIHNVSFLRDCRLPGSWMSILLLISLAGCNLQTDELPHMIHVPSIALETSQHEGTQSARIEDVWVYTETDVYGAFPLPADIPWPMTKGPATLRFLPGIRANGVSATRQPYPFFETLEWDLVPEPGGRDTVIWTTTYNDFAQVSVVEDFELANRFSESITSTSEIHRVTEPEWVFEGEASGRAELTPTEALLVAATNEQQLELNSEGPVWLEMDFSCNQVFAIGLEAHNLVEVTRTPILVLNPTGTEWKKIYLDLGPVVRSSTSAAWFEISLDANYDGSVDTAWLALDNLKIVQYE